MRGLPEDAATWRTDRPKWTFRDELAALQLEATTHWGGVLAAMWAGKKARSLPSPGRLFTHPDRPGPVTQRPGRSQITTDPAEIRAFFNRR